MAFWDRKEILLIDFSPRRESINANKYGEILQRLCRAIKNKRGGLLTKVACLLHGNVRPHTARKMADLLTSFGWDVLNHLSNSSGLAPSDFFLFSRLKVHLSKKRISSDLEIKEAVYEWSRDLATDDFYKGIKN